MDFPKQHYQPHMVQNSHSDSMEIMKLPLKLLHLKTTITQQLSSLIFSPLISLGTFIYLRVQAKALTIPLVSQTWSCRTLPQPPAQPPGQTPERLSTAMCPEASQLLQTPGAGRNSTRGSLKGPWGGIVALTPSGAKVSPGCVGKTHFLNLVVS